MKLCLLIACVLQNLGVWNTFHTSKGNQNHWEQSLNVQYVLCCRTGTNFIGVGYKCNKKKVLSFVASSVAGSTTPGEPYYMRYLDYYGNVGFRKVPCLHLLLEYFKESNCVDVHNQLRQYGLHLEKKWVTSQPYFCLYTTIVGTFHLARFHSVLTEHKAIGFQKLFCDVGDEYECDINAYLIETFVSVMSNQLIKFAE